MTPFRRRCTVGSRCLCAGLCALGLLAGVAARADELAISVRGLSEPLLTNASNRLQALRVSGPIRLTQRRLQRLVEQAEREAALALRPYGYYQARVTSQLDAAGENAWQLLLSIEPGPPLRVAESTVELTGPGATLPELLEWQREWPLGVGAVMDQTVWEAEKQAALDLVASHGYLGARFAEHLIEADLVANTVVTRLQLDTGAQAVMGQVRYEQDQVRDGILEVLPRFSAGQPYDAWLLEKFRFDLWRTGYFDNIEIIEERRLEDEPPTVDLLVRATPRKPNVYQGSLGFGTDTGIRAQLHWNRYLLSRRGDQFDMGVGWQEKFNQYSFRSAYRRPRVDVAREFWIADLLLNRENQELRVRPDDGRADYIVLGSGNVSDYSIRAGRQIVRDFERGYQQIFETWYAQYLYETTSLDGDIPPVVVPGTTSAESSPLRRDTTSALVLGVNWDWPSIRGSAFETVGHHQRAWAMTAQDLWGSRSEFSQIYVSTSWNWMLGERWKLLLRGEVGYTDAEVTEVELLAGDERLQLSVTELPVLYRFKAGGSRSVRGYAFESLSNNGLGSNHIVTASAELEAKIFDRWSLAAFFDAGNAFNDWSDYELRKGVGVGIRWYSIAGAIRFDVAQALDLEDEPWRMHFTIGIPLL
jgi:translocation and assembly module TamA